MFMPPKASRLDIDYHTPARPVTGIGVTDTVGQSLEYTMSTQTDRCLTTTAVLVKLQVH